jgi:hypothetical protein
MRLDHTVTKSWVSGWIPALASTPEQGLSIIICTSTGPTQLVIGSDGQPVHQQGQTHDHLLSGIQEPGVRKQASGMAAVTPILIFHNGCQYPGSWNLAPDTRNAAVCASLLPSVGLRARRAPGGWRQGLVAQLVRARA